MKATIPGGETSDFSDCEEILVKEDSRYNFDALKELFHSMHVRGSQNESLQALLLTLPPKKIKYYVLQIYKTR